MGAAWRVAAVHSRTRASPLVRGSPGGGGRSGPGSAGPRAGVTQDNMKMICYVSSYLLHPLVYVDDGRDDVGGDSVHVAVQHRAPGIPPYAVVVSALPYSHVYDDSIIHSIPQAL